MGQEDMAGYLHCIFMRNEYDTVWRGQRFRHLFIMKNIIVIIIIIILVLA